MSEESIFPAPRAQTNGQEENKNGSSTEGARPNHPWIVGGPGFAGNGQFCILDWVTLAPGGNKFSGTFTVDQYDESGNVLVLLLGTITGTRIDVNTPAESIF
jgi:hypothetical protein